MDNSLKPPQGYYHWVPDRRSAPRGTCAAQTSCYWHEPERGQEQLVGIHDLSKDGIGLVLPLPYSVGDRRRLRLENQTCGFESTRLARVVSEPICMPNDSWLTGCQFDSSLQPDELALLLF